MTGVVGGVCRRGLARAVTGALVAGLLTAGVGAVSVVAAPAAQASAGPVPGMVAHPIDRVHLEVYEWFNILQVVDGSNRIVRTIKIAGNPTIPKPDLCYTAGGIRVNWDVTLTWQLNWFTRMCSGRGMGTHDIPINRYTGRRSMNAADLGKPPFRGGPLSHGCLRMAAIDAEYIYEHYSNGVPVYFVKTPWRPAGPLPPVAPATVLGHPGQGSLSVAWSAAPTRGAAVTAYVVTLWPGALTLTLPATARSAAFTGLVNGTAYYARVAAVSALGSSAPSAWSAAIVPFGPPGGVARLVAVRGPGDFAYVSWQAAPGNGAAVTSYRVSVDGQPPVALAPPIGPFVLRGVPAGQPLHLEVVAVNAAGPGPVVTFDPA